jgi:Cft2 family RNA processing exonuclease/dsRNA-specific ribonuclease
MSSAKITFLGGASNIGASCALLETDAANILVDCGIRFQPGNALPDLASLHGKRLDAIVLTHAHTDHTGALPVVCDAFPGTPVYATPPTADLVAILLRDALRIMNAADRDAEVPLYTELQVQQALQAIRPVNAGELVEIYGVGMRWFPSSHILGASMVHLSTPAGQILFTGDYSVAAQSTVPALTRPSVEVDLLVSEATYGERLHEDRAAAEGRLLDQIRKVTEAGGRVLIPAFAIGRAQEVLRILKRALSKGELPPVPVHVDGMVRGVCDVYQRHPRWVSRQLEAEIRHGSHPFYTDLIQPVRSPEDRTRALEDKPAIFVASSGMLSGGASVTYARALALCADDAILITGYQDEESPGRALLNLASGQGPRTLRLGESTVEVACKVASYGLSAHADRLEMTGVIESLRPRTVVLVHGDESAKQALSRSLSCRDVVLASDGEIVLRKGRSGPSNKRAPSRELPGEGDVHRVRSLLGPPGDEPIRDRAISEAWYGDGVSSEEVQQLVTRLEGLGLVRRDDRRRNWLWVLAPQETDAFPDEAALERDLKEQNPKGELLELCMRIRCAAPTTEASVEGAFHVSVMSLEYASKLLRTSPQRASSRKLSEQLAARELLGLLDEMLEIKDACVVDDDLAAALQEVNPKGKLLERCLRERRGTPQFEQRPNRRGYAVQAVVDVLRSHFHVSRQLKLAEHAAAAELLVLLSGDQETVVPVPAVAPSRPPRGDARMRLNELRQVGLLEGFGYELIERRGPSHQPVFVVVAWAEAGSLGRIESAETEARSKKEAERAAAEGLMVRLEEEGLVAAVP